MFETKLQLIGNRADQKLDADGEFTTEKVVLTFKGKRMLEDKVEGETYTDRAEFTLTVKTGPVGRDIVLTQAALEKIGELIHLSFEITDEPEGKTPESNKINRMSPTRSIMQHFENL